MLRKRSKALSSSPTMRIRRLTQTLPDTKIKPVQDSPAKTNERLTPRPLVLIEMDTLVQRISLACYASTWTPLGLWADSRVPANWLSIELDDFKSHPALFAMKLLSSACHWNYRECPSLLFCWSTSNTTNLNHEEFIREISGTITITSEQINGSSRFVQAFSNVSLSTIFVKWRIH